MRAYSDLYLDDAQRHLGSMLDFAVNACGFNLSEFYGYFLQSSMARPFEAGAPNVVAGRSGTELALVVIDQVNPYESFPAQFLRDLASGGMNLLEYCWERARVFAPVGGASPEYWVGWALAYYQWSCGVSFAYLEELVPIEQVLNYYHPYHEMDVTAFCALMDDLLKEQLNQRTTELKRLRRQAGMSQSQLAFASGIPVRTIQQYEQRQKDIGKAQARSIVALARVLHCDPALLVQEPELPRQNEISYQVVTLDSE